MVFKWKCKNTISKYNELDFFADIIMSCRVLNTIIKHKNHPTINNLRKSTT